MFIHETGRPAVTETQNGNSIFLPCSRRSELTTRLGFVTHIHPNLFERIHGNDLLGRSEQLPRFSLPVFHGARCLIDRAANHI